MGNEPNIFAICSLLANILIRSCHNLHMCGRYRLSRRKQLVEEYFDAVPGEEEWTPRYNIAPTQPVPIIRQNPKEPRRELSLVRWGLIPWWAKDSSGAAMMINAPTPCFRKGTAILDSQHGGELADDFPDKSNALIFSTRARAASAEYRRASTCQTPLSCRASLDRATNRNSPNRG